MSSIGAASALRSLVRRLASPQLALRLQQQEICLAMSALAQFPPGSVVSLLSAPHTSESSADSHATAANGGASAPAVVSARDMRLFVSKAAAIVPFCSGLELQWIAEALPSLTTSSGDEDAIAEALLQRCLALCGEPEMRLKVETISAVISAVVTASPLAAQSATVFELCEQILRRFPQDTAKMPLAPLVRALSAALQLISYPSVTTVSAPRAAAFAQRTLKPLIASLSPRVASLSTDELIGALVAVTPQFPPMPEAMKTATEPLLGPLVEQLLREAEAPARAAQLGPSERQLASDLRAHCTGAAAPPTTPPATLHSCSRGDVAAAIVRLRVARVMKQGVAKTQVLNADDAALARHLLSNSTCMAQRCSAEVAAVLCSELCRAEDAAVALLGTGAVAEEVLERFPEVLVGMVRGSLPGGLRDETIAALRAVGASELSLREVELDSPLITGRDPIALIEALAASGDAVDSGTKPSRWLLLSRLLAIVGEGIDAESGLAAMTMLRPDEHGALASALVQHVIASQQKLPVGLDAPTLAALLEEMRRLHLRGDQVLIRFLGDAVLHCASSANPSLPSSDLTRLAAAVSTFPALSAARAALAEMIRTAPTSGTVSDVAVTALPATLLDKAMRGETIDEGDVVKLAQSDVWGPDDLARVAAALGYARKDPSGLAASLTRVASGLRIDSCIIVLRAMAAAPKLRHCTDLYLAVITRCCELLRRSDEMVADALVAFEALQPTRQSAFVAQAQLFNAKRRVTLADAGVEQDFLAAACDKIAVNIQHTPTKDLCKSLSALSYLENAPTGLLTVAAKALVLRAPTMTFKHITQALKMLAAHDVSDEQLVDALLRRVHSKFLPTSAPQTLRFDRDAIEAPSPEAVAEFLAACKALDTPELDTIHIVESRRLLAAVDTLSPAQLVAATLALPSGGEGKGHGASGEVVTAALKKLTTTATEIASASLGHAAACVTLHRPDPSIAIPLLKALTARAAELIGVGTAVSGGHLVALLHAVAQYGGPSNLQERIASGDAVDIQEWLTELVEVLNPDELTTLAETMYKLDLTRRSLVHNTFVAFARNVAKFRPRQICDVTFNIGQLFRSPEEVELQELDLIVDHCVDNVEAFTHGPSIVRLLTGFTKLMQTTNRNPYVVFATQLRKRPILHSLSRSDVTMAIAAFGGAKLLDQSLFSALAQRVVKLGHEFSVADVVLTVSGYSNVYLLNDALYDTMGHRAAELADEFTPQAANLLLRGYATLNIPNDNMCDKLIESFSSKRPDSMDAQNAAQMLHSMCRMDFMDANAYGFLAESICKNVEQLTATDVSNVCDVMRHTNWREETLLQALGDQAVRLAATSQLDATVARNVLDTMGTFLVHHAGARRELSSLAKTVSREVLPEGSGDQTGATASIGA